MLIPIAPIGLLAYIERMGLAVLYLLALGGMYLVAFLFMSGAEKAVMKMGPGLVINQKNPKVAKALKYGKHGLSMTLVGLIAWALMWSGPGGGPGGLLPSGDDVTNKAMSFVSPTPPQISVTQKSTTKETRKEETKLAKDYTEQIITVEMLGGSRVASHRFYLVKGEPQARNLKEVEEVIQSRIAAMQSNGRPRLRIVISEDNESVASNHPAVIDLLNWAQSKSLDVQTVNYAESKSP